MAEWVGPQRISQPNAWPHSMTRSRCATAAARIFGSGEIGLVSGPITVTAVAPRPRLCQPLAQPLERREIGRVEDRDLDGVEAEDLDLVEDRVVLLGDVGRPQEQVHAGFHLVVLQPSGSRVEESRVKPGDQIESRASPSGSEDESEQFLPGPEEPSASRPPQGPAGHQSRHSKQGRHSG